MASFSQEVLDRFWSKVNKNGPTMSHMDTACWEWTAGKSNGYGMFKITGIHTQAHRVSWLISYYNIVGRLQWAHVP